MAIMEAMIDPRIWKYELAITDSQYVEMPNGANIFCAQVQNGACCLWAVCDASRKKEPRKIRIYRTGHLMDLGVAEIYIGTVQFENGLLVFHIFEEIQG